MQSQSYILLILRICEYKVLNMKVKGKHARVKMRSRWEQARKDVTKNEHGKKLRRRSCGKTQMKKLGC
jgi:hypothetical protein